VTLSFLRGPKCFPSTNAKPAYSNSCETSDLTFSETAYDTFTDNVESPKLSEDVKETLESPLTYEECKKILDTFQNDKAPGEDGFTVEFYTHFFELLGND